MIIDVNELLQMNLKDVTIKQKQDTEHILLNLQKSIIYLKYTLQKKQLNALKNTKNM